MTRSTLMQYFEWYLPADHDHWNRLKNDAPHLKELGISHVWTPPAFKATGPDDVGYGIYDLFDLGEFDQKGTIPTKYGTKDEYLAAIHALNEQGIAVIADIVLNHKAGGDYQESFQVRRMNPDNRQESLSEPYEIKGYTGYDFQGRNDVYNDFKWHWYHFTGLDFDAAHNETGIYQIVGENKGWANQDQVDGEHGNYDYLMFNDIDFKHPEVVEHLKDWVKWFIETTQVDGFRIDAAKHIGEDYIASFMEFVRQEIKPDLYAFAEYWKDSEADSQSYIDGTDYQLDLVDVPLHMNFFQAGNEGQSFDLRTIFDGSLVKTKPDFAVTFVENHDTQRGQALESTVADWFKPAAYALILLRQQGLPTLFYGDYYGISGEFGQAAFNEILDKLLAIRQHHTYGPQVDYLDHPNCIGWVCQGDNEHPKGLACVISNADEGYKDMDMGTLNAGKVFVDATGHRQDTIQLDENGWGRFYVNPGSVSVWVEE
ncbi:alpha-amylase [Streptococcus sp. P25B114]